MRDTGDMLGVRADLEKFGADLRPVFERNRVIRAVVFGSRARGETTRRSDLDLVVVQETDRRHFLDRYEDLYLEVVRALSVECEQDLLVYTPAEVQRLRSEPFLFRVFREGYVLYERNQEPSVG